MDIEKFLNDKTRKPKEKIQELSKLILDNVVTIKEVISGAENFKPPVKGACIEAIEFATKKDPAIATYECLQFVSSTLNDKAPRVKWESAKVIGNIAHLFPGKLDTAIANLLTNTEDAGTVVRWSAAYALGEIVQLKDNRSLIPALTAIKDREEKNSIKKIYNAALKKVQD
ncbi:MAG: HEAT repeat domain-containing protein [Bacteroidia bacterium]